MATVERNDAKATWPGGALVGVFGRGVRKAEVL